MQLPRVIASIDARWYPTKAGMSSSYRIVAAVLLLIGLVPTSASCTNIICVELSGQIGYACDDVVPDDMLVNPGAAVQFGFPSQNCGICHDYAVGQAVSESSQDSALPVPVIGLHQIVPSELIATLRNELHPVGLLDSSGRISLLTC